MPGGRGWCRGDRECNATRGLGMAAAGRSPGLRVAKPSPAAGTPQGESAILPGSMGYPYSIRPARLLWPAAGEVWFDGPEAPTYHPPDVERATPVLRAT